MRPLEGGLLHRDDEVSVLTKRANVLARMEHLRSDDRLRLIDRMTMMVRSSRMTHPSRPPRAKTATLLAATDEGETLEITEIRCQ